MNIKVFNENVPIDEKTIPHKILIRGHPLRVYANFPKTVLIWGLEMLIFRKILRKYLTDGPSSFAYT